MSSLYQLARDVLWILAPRALNGYKIGDYNKLTSKDYYTTTSRITYKHIIVKQFFEEANDCALRVLHQCDLTDRMPVIRLDGFG